MQGIFTLHLIIYSSIISYVIWSGLLFLTVSFLCSVLSSTNRGNVYVPSQECCIFITIFQRQYFLIVIGANENVKKDNILYFWHVTKNRDSGLPVRRQTANIFVVAPPYLILFVYITFNLNNWTESLVEMSSFIWKGVRCSWWVPQFFPTSWAPVQEYHERVLEL